MQLFPGIGVDEPSMNGYFDLYRHLHQHPELSMHEYKTAQLIEERLKNTGAETFRCGATGVVGILRNGIGPVIAFRADIDGLPMKEETGLLYASTDTSVLSDGSVVPVMHGCGHDLHITAAIAAAEVLASKSSLWSGTLVFIFQPGEETAAGSSAMVDDGLWKRAPIPIVILGQHVGPCETGTAETRTRDVMSLADAWEVIVHGKGAHGSQPERSIDPIVTAAYMITRLQTVVSRELSAHTSAVVTVGTFHAGLKENIIPSEAVFTLNIRTPNEEVRADVLSSLRRIIHAGAMAAGAREPTITELYRFPRCYNDEHMTSIVTAALVGEFGDPNVNEARPRSMGSEDFGWLGDSIGVPTVFWWFGAFSAARMSETDTVPGNHSAFFGPDLELAIETGIRSALAAIMAYVVVEGVGDGSNSKH